jgi:hypothetical protein
MGHGEGRGKKYRGKYEWERKFVYEYTQGRVRMTGNDPFH